MKTKHKKNFKAKNLAGRLFVSYVKSFDHPFKIRFLHYIAALLFPNGITFVSPFNTLLKLKINNFLGNHIIQSGSYEPNSLDLVISLLAKEKDPVFLDVGANFGLYTISCLKIKNITSYSFEPVAANFVNLKSNLLLNQLGNNNLINIGLGDISSLHAVSNPTKGNDGTYRIEDGNLVKGDLIMITTLDSVIDHYKIQKIDVLKIDVEGYEQKVLEGFKTIKTIKPANIILEFSDYVERVKNTKQEIYDFLISCGYEALMVDGTTYRASKAIVEDNLWFKLK